MRGRMGAGASQIPDPEELVAYLRDKKGVISGIIDERFAKALAEASSQFANDAPTSSKTYAVAAFANVAILAACQTAF